MVLEGGARDNIRWCLQNIENSGRVLRELSPKVVIFTDASNEGWGAHVDDLATRGRWSESEKVDHINVLELRAILLGLKSLCREVEPGSHIRIMTDNTTALAYVKHFFFFFFFFLLLLNHHKDFPWSS